MVLTDVWVDVILGGQERARKVIGALTETPPFEVRYTNVEGVEWETCTEVLEATEKRRVLLSGWKDR